MNSTPIRTSHSASPLNFTFLSFELCFCYNNIAWLRKFRLAVRSLRLQFRGARKQDVVLQMNVLVQIGFELNQRSEQRAIGIACFDGDRIVARELSHLHECPTGALVLMLHASDGMLDAAERHHLAVSRFKFCDGWKQNQLLPHHVCLQLFSERGKSLAHLKKYRLAVSVSAHHFREQLCDPRQF